MQSIGYIAANRHKVIRGFVPELRHQIHTAEGRIAWEKINYKELEPFLLKWQVAVAILCKSEVFTQGLYDFFADRKFYPGFDQAKLSEILNYLKNRFGAYFRKDITLYERRILESIRRDIFEGVQIQGVLVFPEIYYPYMDRLYFNHTNWNLLPMGVAISDVLAHKGKYILAIIDSGARNQVIKEENMKCGCSESGGSCNSSDHPHLLTDQNVFGIKWESEASQEVFTERMKYPFIFISYWVKGGNTIPKFNADCRCFIPYKGEGLGSSRCTTAGTGFYCGKYSNGACGQACTEGEIGYPTLGY